MQATVDSRPGLDTLADPKDKVQVLERKQPAAAEIDPAVEAERRELRERKLEAQLTTWVASRRADLLDAGELAVNLESVRRR